MTMTAAQYEAPRPTPTDDSPAWRHAQRAHATAHPEHMVNRDPTMAGHIYCYGCHRYIR